MLECQAFVSKMYTISQACECHVPIVHIYHFGVYFVTGYKPPQSLEGTLKDIFTQGQDTK